MLFRSGAGATVYHNHSQILSTPILPPDILRSISGSEDYYRKNDKKVHEVMLKWEISEGQRIIYDNDGFVSFCPYVSKTPYETRIFPKESSPRFEEISDGNLKSLAETLGVILKKVDKLLDGSDFNFYIHTAPIKKNRYIDDSFYHWHMEIIPRLSVVGGLELGTDVYVNVVNPDEAAKLLRETNS